MTATTRRQARISPGARTNVPRWPAAPPPLPPGARWWVVVDLGAPDVAAAWAVTAAVGSDRDALTTWPLPGQPAPGRDDELSSVAAAITDVARVGTRVAICGAEADVMLVRAGLLEGGFLDEEVLTHATSAGEIRVRCAHCGAVSRHDARPGHVIRCARCGFDVVVHHHFSRPLGAYLAFRADGGTRSDGASAEVDR